MKRRLFKSFSTLSLLLCLACTFLWVRSGYRMDYIWRESGEESCVLLSSEGRLQLSITHRAAAANLAAVPWSWDTFDAPKPRPNWKWLWPGYETHRWVTIATKATYTFVLPYWLLTLSAVYLPVHWLWKWQSARKAARPRGFEVQPASSPPAV